MSSLCDICGEEQDDTFTCAECKLQVCVECGHAAAEICYECADGGTKE